MKKFKKKGFTLIELIAVLVIMAILALIVTPLVMNIIRKARVSADKRSVDAYGRSIELAIAGYLLDNGKFPTSVDQLTIEYSGNQVECETTQINTDSSVYLAGCTVAGRSVDGYTYGKEEAAPTYIAYSVGDEVRYNNVDYYVIEDSETDEDSVTLLKKTPLTVDEVNEYGGAGTENNHVNRHVTGNSRASDFRKATDHNGYGGMAYYTSSACGYGSAYVGCTNDYDSSEIKYVVDAWKIVKAPAANEARLITIDEVKNLGYEWYDNGSVAFWTKTENTPTWVYNSNYWYWTMSQLEDSASSVWRVRNDGSLDHDTVINSNNVVRPVITLSKSSISS